jgi:hypothetical protein
MSEARRALAGRKRCEGTVPSTAMIAWARGAVAASRLGPQEVFELIRGRVSAVAQRVAARLRRDDPLVQDPRAASPCP